MFKRIVALLLSCFLVFSMLPSFAEEGLSDEEIAELTSEIEENDATAENAAHDLTSEEIAAMDEIGAMLDSEEGEEVDTTELELNEDLPQNVINILLLGIDNRSVDLQTGRSDATMICSINLDTGSVKLTSFCRDLAVDIPGYKTMRPINNAFKFGSKNGDIDKGARLAMRTINKNYQMNLQYYVVVNIYGLAAIIDSVGGVDMNMTKSEAYLINYELFEKEPMNKDGVTHTKLEVVDGVQHLDGMQATTYGRIRNLKGQNDVNRNGRQRAMLGSVISKVMNGLDFVSLLSIIETALPYARTNLTTSEIAKLGMAVLSGDAMSAISSGNLEGAIGSFGIPLDGEYGYKTFGDKSCVYIATKASKKGQLSRMDKTMTAWFDFLFDGNYPYSGK